MATGTAFAAPSVRSGLKAAGIARGSHQQRRRFPRLPLYGALTLTGFAIAATLFGQTTGIGTLKSDLGDPIAVRDIVVSVDGADLLSVRDAGNGALIAQYVSGEGGFVRGSQRAFNRMRMLKDVPNEMPYRLIRWQNGAVSLSDTGTGQRYYLNAFGVDNAEAFADLLAGHGRIQK